MHSMSNCHQKNRNATRAIRRIAGLVLAANLFAVLPVALGRDAARPCERKDEARRDVDAMHAVDVDAVSAPGLSFAPQPETVEVLRRYYKELNQR